MATIANQIKRISDSRDLLRERGQALGLKVPAGNYWDDTTNTYKAYSVAALTGDDQIDKIAAAFNTIELYRDANGKNEVRVPISVRKDDSTTVVETTTLDPGYYYNTTVIPYIKVEQVEDIVINVEMISERVLEEQIGTILPSSGFNYIGQFGYKIKSGSVDTANNGYGNNYVTAKIKESGWVVKDATTKITVPESVMSSKVGSETASISSGSDIVPNAVNDTEITITKGIYGTDRTLKVKSVKSQTTPVQGEEGATKDDILSGKVAWVNGQKVKGEMPNHGGTGVNDIKATAAASFNSVGGKLAIQPILGYYNDYSTITTSIVYNPTRVFNTTSITVGGTDTMEKQTYYETIPAGYYHTAITRKVTAKSAVVTTSVDYTTHKAILNVAGFGGWVSGPQEIAINAGPARFELTKADLAANTVTLAPARDKDGTLNSYLTEVTIDNTVIFNALSAI